MALKYKKGSKVPYSDAKTAYGLLNDVIAAILEEPKRLYMGCWGGSAEYLIGEIRNKQDDQTLQGPACETIGCISGWISTLKPLRQVNLSLGENIIAPYVKPESNLEDYNRRVDMRGAVNDLFMGVRVSAKYGTRRYARIVVNRIKKFQRAWATDLRSVKV